MKKFVLLLALISLKTAIYAQGSYIEFKITSGSANGSGTVKSYSQDGNTRSEATISAPQLPNGIKITSLILKAQPNTIYLLNDKDKTYSEIQSGNSDEYKDYPQADYEVTVVGKETVNGYNSTHVIIKVNGKQSREMWTTKDIAGYADFSKIKTKYTGQDNMYKALAAKGADGMPVRIKTTEGGRSMQLDLIKAEKRSNPATLFSLSGYTKNSSASGIPSVEGMPDMQEMMKKLQNMTPAEREAMLKKLKEMYQQQPK
jgi:hypothetical protein